MPLGIWNNIQRGFVLLILVSLTACTDALDRSELVYDNDFSNLDLAGFENARLFIFQNDTVNGFYHNEEISLLLEGLPIHNQLKVTSEILIHDSWDGNPADGGGPDMWFFGVDGVEVYRTTFSNSPCVPTYCLHQSYPQDYFRQNFPKTGAIQTNLPGLCIFGALENYTTRYRITKIIPHQNSFAKIFWNSELINPEFVADPVCDESWSLAKVTVEAMLVN